VYKNGASVKWNYGQRRQETSAKKAETSFGRVGATATTSVQSLVSRTTRLHYIKLSSGAPDLQRSTSQMSSAIWRFVTSTTEHYREYCWSCKSI